MTETTKIHAVHEITSDKSPLARVEACGHINGLLMEMCFTQYYCNHSDRPVEIVYTFPLARDAVPLDIRCRIGDREMNGHVTAKSQALDEYEGALGKGDSAVLLSRAADGMISASLGNLLPGESAQIELRYGQLLNVANGVVRLAFPTVIAPRYGDSKDAGLEPFEVPEDDLNASYPFEFTLEIRGALARANVSCPSHTAQITRQGEALRIHVSRAKLDRDLVLLAESLPEEASGYAALGRDGEQVVALASTVVPALQTKALPIAVKVLVDCSGSMAGDSIDEAREALGNLLKCLDAGDLLSLSRFGSTCDHMLDEMRPINGIARRHLRQMIGELKADLGGTEMESALSEVYDLPMPEGGAVVLLITDGEIYSTESLIAAASQSRHRLFIVAVGASPAESWLSKLADETGGAIEFVSPHEDIKGAIGRICDKLRKPRQPLRAVRWPGHPDLIGEAPAEAYEGETLHLFARLPEMPHGELNVEFASNVLTRTFPAECQNTDILARLFAAQRLRFETNAKSRQQIALAYQLLTEDTSWVLTLTRAESEKGSAVPQLQKVPQMTAAGWSGFGQICNHTMFEINMSESDGLYQCAEDILDESSTCCSSIRLSKMAGEPDQSYTAVPSKAAKRGRSTTGVNIPCAIASNAAPSDSSQLNKHQKQIKFSTKMKSAGAALLSLFKPGSRRSQRLQLTARQIWSSATLNELPRRFDDLLSAGVPETAIQSLRQLLSQGSEEAIICHFIVHLLEELGLHAACDAEIRAILRRDMPGDRALFEKIRKIVRDSL